MSRDTHWYVLINPEQYNDADDKGFAWSGPAQDIDHAVELAIVECETMNEFEDGIDRETCQVWDAHVDLDHHAKELRRKAPEITDLAQLQALIQEELADA